MKSHLSLYRLIPLVLLFFSSPITSIIVRPRGQCCGGACDDGETDDDGNPLPVVNHEQPDGISDDGRPGIGFEFEAGGIKLEPEGDCTEEKMENSKGKRISDRAGTNWELTADTTLSGVLTAEYIINGKTVRLGENDAMEAARGIAEDLAKWDPHVGMNGIEVKESECNNWKITSPEKAGESANKKWAPQVTAPMPLEAVQELFKKTWTNDQSHLLIGETVRPDKRKDMTYVTKDFFQSSPGGIKVDDLKDDALGFFSLVLSYAKAKKMEPGDDELSIKEKTTIMPRNDFTSMYSLLKDNGRLPPFQGSLFDVFKVLACYKNKEDGIVDFDTEFCKGDFKKPEPIDKVLEGREYSRGGDSCNMKDWIDGIAAGKEDLLSRVDQKVDASVGHFGNKWEKVLGTDRQVPLFEFRRLQGLKANKFEQAVHDIQEEIVDLHRRHANAPRRIRRSADGKYSHIARNAPQDGCPSATHSGQPSSTAPPPTQAATIECKLQHEDPDQGINEMGCICGSTTLPLLTVTSPTDMAQSCAYTALPTTSVANPITTAVQTFQRNCYPCTLVGGIADEPTCASTPVKGCTPTTPATPTATVFLSNNSIPIGDEKNKDSSAELRKDLFQKLKTLCPDDKSACDSKTKAEFDNIPTVVGTDEGQETLKFTIQDSTYNSIQERDRLLAAAVATWQSAVSKSCKEVFYEDPEVPTASGCGTGPVRRGTPERALMSYKERRLNPRKALPAPICDNCPPPDEPECHYKAKICAGPDHINPILGNATDPYANHMNIQLEYSLGYGNSAFDEFICSLIVDGLAAIALAVAPELASVEIWEDLELEALCQGMNEHFGS